MVFEELGQQYLQENELVFTKPKQQYFKGNEVLLDKGGLKAILSCSTAPRIFFVLVPKCIYLVPTC